MFSSQLSMTSITSEIIDLSSDADDDDALLTTSQLETSVFAPRSQSQMSNIHSCLSSSIILSDDEDEDIDTILKGRTSRPSASQTDSARSPNRRSRILESLDALDFTSSAPPAKGPCVTSLDVVPRQKSRKRKSDQGLEDGSDCTLPKRKRAAQPRKNKVCDF